MGHRTIRVKIRHLLQVPHKCSPPPPGSRLTGVYCDCSHSVNTSMGCAWRAAILTLLMAVADLDVGWFKMNMSFRVYDLGSEPPYLQTPRCLRLSMDDSSWSIGQIITPKRQDGSEIHKYPGGWIVKNHETEYFLTLPRKQAIRKSSY